MSMSQCAARGGSFLAFKVVLARREPSIIGRAWDLISLQSQRRACLQGIRHASPFYLASLEALEPL